MLSALKAAHADSEQRAGWMVAAASKAAPARGSSLAQLGFSPNYLQSQRADVDQHAEQLKHFNGRPYSAISAVAKRIAGQPFRVGRRVAKGAKLPKGRVAKRWLLPTFRKGIAEDVELIEQHPALDLMADPNPLMTGWALKFVTVASLELTGKAYWWLDRRPVEPVKAGMESTAKTSPATAVWPIPASWVTPIHEGKPFSAWDIRPPWQSQSVRVLADDLAYFYYPNPADPFGAVSPLQAMSRSVSAHESMADSKRKVFQQSCEPGLIMKIGRHPDLKGVGNERPILTQEQRAQIVSWIKSRYQGFSSWNEPLIIDGIVEEVTKWQQNPREMDYLRSGQQTEAEIDQGFGVNPIIMGKVESVNRASSLAAQDSFLMNKVNPLIDLMNEILSSWIAVDFAGAGEDVFLFLEPAQIEDPDLILQEDALLVTAGVLLANEMRQRHRLDELPELEDRLCTSAGLVPLDQEEADRLEAQAEAMAQLQNGPPQNGPPQNGPPQNGPPQNGPPQNGPPKPVEEEMQKALAVLRQAAEMNRHRPPQPLQAAPNCQIVLPDNSRLVEDVAASVREEFKAFLVEFTATIAALPLPSVSVQPPAVAAPVVEVVPGVIRPVFEVPTPEVKVVGAKVEVVIPKPGKRIKRARKIGPDEMEIVEEDAP